MARMTTPALAFAALLTVGAAHGAGPDQPAPGPPLDPAGEARVPMGPNQSIACLSRLLDTVSRDGGRLDRTLVTKSDRWGQVLRADVIYPGGGAGRAVCWNDALKLNRSEKLDALPLPVAKSRKASGAHCNYTPIDNPCRGEPVAMVWLCVRPSFYLYADGHAAPVSADNALAVDFINRGTPESDAAWTARCAGKGGVFRAEQ